MDAVAILSLVAKGLTMVPDLLSAGKDVIGLVNKLRGVAEGGAAGTTTPEDLAALEAELDAAIAEFNAPIE